MMNDKKTKLTLEINGTVTTWEKDSIDCDFAEILNGFLGCMWGQTFVPGTEVHCFEDYLSEMKDMYRSEQDIIESNRLEAVY